MPPQVRPMMGAPMAGNVPGMMPMQMAPPGAGMMTGQPMMPGAGAPVTTQPHANVQLDPFGAL